jgi:hypothetical protein
MLKINCFEEPACASFDANGNLITEARTGDGLPPKPTATTCATG